MVLQKSHPANSNSLICRQRTTRSFTTASARHNATANDRPSHKPNNESEETMKTPIHSLKLCVSLLVTLLLALLVGLAHSVQAKNASVGGPQDAKATPITEQRAAAIPMDQIGAVAQKQYSGDGLSVVATDNGALLRCVFQRMEGRATADGLWLTSTVDGAKGEPFRVKAVAVRREVAKETSNIHQPTSNIQLQAAGKVAVADKTVRFIRPGVTEEYSVSMDGVRQDFIIEQPPLNSSSRRSEAETNQPTAHNSQTGQLLVELAVDGAKAEQLAEGVRLVLVDGARKIVYNRLHVTDASGNKLLAKLEVLTDNRLAITLNDTAAEYPVRIDPTFSDANWFVLGTGMNSSVYALAVSGSNVYAGGNFTNAGGVSANYIAKWDGISWTPLGSGMNSNVFALAVSGNYVYAGGQFTIAGGIAANRIAQWNGSNWTPLGSGMNGDVDHLAVSGANLYAGGYFTNADNTAANQIVKWDGNYWTPLGSGVFGLGSLAVSGTNIYVGVGYYIWNNGPVKVSYVAKWTGTNWTNLGLGMNNWVDALAVSGSNVYAAGEFTTVTNSSGASVAANYIAKWDGSNWSALGSGLNNWVEALAVSGNDVYAGGGFWMAGGIAANWIAKWDGSNWSALGSGMNNLVYALDVFGTNLYAGGYFTTAGGKPAPYVAKAIVHASPTITSISSDADKMNGDSVTFSASVIGDLPISYHWYRDDLPLADGIRTSGSTTPVLTITNLAASDAGRYRLAVNNDYGSTTSAWVNLRILPNVTASLVGKLPLSSAWTVTVAGTNAYLGASPLQIISVANPASPVLLGGYTNGTSGGEIAVKGNYAYVAEFASGLQIFNVSNPRNPVLVGAIGNFAFGILGVAISGDFAYCSDGVSCDVVSYSLLNPANPVAVGGLYDTYGSGGFIDSAGSLAFLANGDSINGDGLHIIDTSNPTNLVLRGVCSVPGAIHASVSGNICGAAKRYYDFYTVDVHAPAQPAVLGHYQTISTINDIELSGNMAFMAGYAGLEVLDLSDPTRPTKLCTFPSSSPDGPTDLAVAGGYIYFVESTGLSIISLHTNSPVAPVLVEQPAPQSVPYGSAVAFVVGADGAAGLHYQWIFNGSLLAGETNSILWIPDVQPPQTGGYSVIVTNVYGSVTSSVAMLTVPNAPAVIIIQPQSRTNAVGTEAAFTVAAAGMEPLAYRWRKDGTNLVNGGNLSGVTTTNLTISNVQLTNAGNYTVVITNAYGSMTSSVATLTVFVAPTLTGALDSTNFTWTAGGDVPWFAQTQTTHDGVDAAQSGVITNGQESWIQTTVIVPGTLTYWWKVSSEQSYDYLEFYVDGVRQGTRISGEVDWQKCTNSIASGTHTLRWRYRKDESVDEGQDAGWLDEVSFVPATDLQIMPGSAARLPDGRFQFQVASDAGAVLEIQVSTNLTYWETIATVTNVTGLDWFMDPSTGLARRFFRLKPATVPGLTNGLGDDFSGLIVDSAKWGPDVDQDPGAQFVQTNGHLEFLGDGTVVKPWIGSYGSYNQDWEVIVDVQLGALVVTQDYASASIGLGIGHDDDDEPLGDLVSIQLYYYHDADTNYYREFETMAQTNYWETGYEWEDTPATNATLRISFDAANKTLTAWYDSGANGTNHVWTELLSERIDSLGNDWGMDTNSRFVIGLGGSAYGQTISPGDDVFFDNFATLGGFLPPLRFTLADYYPLPLDADWLYEGTDWDGSPASIRNHVVSANTNITLYTGRSAAVSYTTNCVDVFAGYLDPTTLAPYDTWDDYMAGGGRFGQFGDDDLPDESLRVDGGVIFPIQMTVGSSATNIADAYLFGTFVGVATNILQVLEHTSLTVPAGYFPDVLHVRLTFDFPSGTQVHDEWWARSVGKIMRQGISGDGAAQSYELIQYSVPQPPTAPIIHVSDGSMGFVSNKFGFNLSGQSGQVVVVEGSTNLVNWLPLQTNTLGSSPLYFSDPGSSNFNRRFYRAQSQ